MAARQEPSADALFAAFDRLDVPGASAILISDGRVVYRAAFGAADLEAQVACTPATSYRLASVSKQFTAMAVVLLAERGLISYDDQITRFFADAPPAWGRISVRQLLTHTSGLPDYEELIPADATVPVLDADVLELVQRERRLYAPPGTAFQYSNTGYCLLALIVERVAGRPFAAFLREEIFAPLGMAAVAYEAGRSQIANRAYGYSRRGAGFVRTDQSITSSTLGDGGIYASVDDLALWDAALAEERLVSARALEAAFAPAVALPDGSGGYGFGWYIGARRGLRLAYHTGETVGFRTAIVRYLDRRLTAAVLCNRSDAEPIALAHALADAALP